MSRVVEVADEKEEPRGGREPGGDEGGGPLIRVPKLGWVSRLTEFYQSVKLEMRKTSWPTRSEVWNTTVVVLIAVVFFGFYLFGADWLIARGFEYLEKAIR